MPMEKSDSLDLFAYGHNKYAKILLRIFRIYCQEQ